MVMLSLSVSAENWEDDTEGGEIRERIEEDREHVRVGDSVEAGPHEEVVDSDVVLEHKHGPRNIRMTIGLYGDG